MSELNLGTLTVTIEAATAEFTKQIADVSRSIEELGAAVQPAALAAGAAFAGMAGGIALVTRASAEATAEQVKLNAMITASGKAIDPAAINALAQATQKLSVFDDDAAVAASSLLIRLGMEQKQIEALIPAAADLASATGTDLAGASMALGRAIATGSLTMLQKQGISFDDAAQEAFKFGDAAERTRIITERMATSSGGAAEAFAGTTAGAFLIAKRDLGNLAEAFGSVFEPMAGAALRSVSGAIDGLRASFEALSPAVKGALALLALATTALTGLAAAGLGLIVLLPKLLAGFSAVQAGLVAIGAATGIALAPVLAVTAALGAVVLAGIAFADLLESLGGASSIWQGLKSAVGGVFDSITGWIGEVGSKIRDAIPQAFRDAFSGIAQFNVDVWDTVIGGFLEPVKVLAQAIFDVFSTIGGAIGDVLGTAFDYWAGKLAKLGQGPMIPKPGAPKATGPKPFSMLGDVGAGGEGVRLDAKAEAQKEMDAAARDRARERAHAAEIAAHAAAEREANALLDELSTPAPVDVSAKLDALRQRFAGIDKAAAEARAEFVGGLTDATGGFEDDLGDALYNLAVSVLGPDVVGEFERGMAAAGEALEKVGADLAGKLLGALGGFGSAVAAGMQGFDQAGPIGAAASVFVDALARMPEFEAVGAALTDVLDNLMRAFAPVLTGAGALIKPLADLAGLLGDSLAGVLRPFGTALASVGLIFQALAPFILAMQPIFEHVGSAFSLVARVMAAVVYVILYVMRAIAEVWNGIVSAVQKLFYKLGRIEIFGKQPLGFLEDWGDAMNKAKVSTEAIGDAMDEAAHIAETGEAYFDVVPVEEASDAMGDFADAATEATEALTNVPQGFKVAAARFDASQADILDAAAPRFGASGGGSDSAYASMMAPVTIESVQIVSDDPQAIWSEIKRLIAWDNFAQGGSTQQMAQPYAVQKVT